MNDMALMRRALALAERGRGLTFPNPCVGAVVALDGRIVGEGWHRFFGGPHAEVDALQPLGPAARGATVVVTLEPCSHWGKTPPCADFLVRSKVREVVAAITDPLPAIRGRGFAKLRRGGVRVRFWKDGPLTQKARDVARPYLTWLERKRPFVILKSAVSLDGKIATSGGESKWITSAAARAYARGLRAGVEAVMVGVGTVAADDPSLIAPSDAARQPARGIVDTELRISRRAQVLDGAARAIVLCGPGASPARRARLERDGAEVVPVPVRNGGVDLRLGLAALVERRIGSVLLEGGGELNGSALEARVVDRAAFFVAPLILGGREAKTAVEGTGVSRIAEAMRLDRVQVRRIGSDILIEGDVCSRD